MNPAPKTPGMAYNEFCGDEPRVFGKNAVALGVAKRGDVFILPLDSNFLPFRAPQSAIRI